MILDATDSIVWPDTTATADASVPTISGLHILHLPVSSEAASVPCSAVSSESDIGGCTATQRLKATVQAKVEACLRSIRQYQYGLNADG